MMEDTNDIIRFRNDGRHYSYFQFVLAVLNATIFGNALQPVMHEECITPGFDLEKHNDLIEKFTAAPRTKSATTGLSLYQLIYLMSAIDNISKTLLSDDADQLKMIMLHQIPNLKENWDKDFLKGAQAMFQTFEKLFKDFPEYKKMLQIVINQS